MSQPSVVLGVDGGGSKTICIAVEVNSQKVVGRSVAGPSNWNSVGLETAAQTIQEAITGCLTAAARKLHHVAAICMGMSGCDTAHDEHQWLEAVSRQLPADLRSTVPVAVYNDSVAALACGTAGQLLGCVLIAGTGTIAYAVSREGVHTRAAGWGPAFLDGGSGYDLGHRALGAVARASDGRGPATALLPAVRAAASLEGPDLHLLGWAYGEPGWARIASLAQVVLRCAQDGDAVAAAIVAAGIGELVAAVRAALARAGLPAAFPLVLAGGLLQQGSYYLQECSRVFAQEFPQAQLLHPQVEAAHGAALLATGMLKAQMAQH